MDWTCYKALCDRPDYWSHWMLEQCIELFAQLGEHSLSARLQQALSSEPLRSPPGHRGPPATRMYRLELSPNQRRCAVHAIERAARQGLCTPATAQRGLGGFVEAWREYAHYRV